MSLELFNTNNKTKNISIGYLGPKILAPIQIQILSGILKVTQENNINFFHFGGPFPQDQPNAISQSSNIFKLLSTKRLSGIICWSSQLLNQDGYFFNIEDFLEKHQELPAVFIGKHTHQ